MKNYYQKLLIILTLLLISCSEETDKALSKVQGTVHAESTRSEIYNLFLNCYALEYLPKKQCINGLVHKYIDLQYRNNKEYIEAFVFEAEKMAFRYFINNSGRKCEGIKDGPIFVADKNAYRATCDSGEEYLLQFDYDTKEWKML